MKRLTATLVTDGSSDKLLAPLIELLFSANTDLAYQVNFAAGLPPMSTGLKERIDRALVLFPCDFLFVHRDAESISAAARQQEIESHWSRSQQSAALICVIPVRMTEAWLITDSAPIRSAVGNPHGTDTLTLPASKDIESSTDPKAILFAALKAATGWSASRKRRFTPDAYRHRVSELTIDLVHLRKLDSFRHLEEQVRIALMSCQVDFNGGN